MTFGWLKTLLMMYYAPRRAMAELRETGPLAQAAVLALSAQAAHGLLTMWPAPGYPLLRSPTLLVTVFKEAVIVTLFIGVLFVPVIILITSLFERRAGLILSLQQDYAAIGSAVFYSWAAASIVALPLALIARAVGIEAAAEVAMTRVVELQSQMTTPGEVPPEALGIISQALGRALLLLLLSPLPFFAFWITVAVRQVFRVSWLRSIIITLFSSFTALALISVLTSSFGSLLASPFLLLLLFVILRGYAAEVTRSHRERALFKRNLEAATLNPVDASAHYQLGLIHMQRREFAEARERFQRAIEIDADEVDAHFQLGRINRRQNDLPAAIREFEEVVVRDPQHAQNELWREIGATYIAAEQFADAHDALEKFLEKRQTDPEGLYLAGRALAGMGRRREAVELMRACIEAVRSSPAYKYRTEKRWLNEAQHFLRSQA